MTQTEVVPQNPLEAGPKPPFPKQHQEAPGVESAMQPQPDHGEYTYRGQNKLAGKVALVTGGDSGLGKAIAIAFSRERADVAISHKPEEEEDAADTVRWVEDAERKALSLPGDVSDGAFCRDIVERTVQEFGRLDVLVNNAGFSHNRPSILEMPFEEWDYTFKVNLYAMFHTCKAAIPHMKPGAAIINVASVETFEPDPNALAYSTTKGAIVTFSKSLGGQVIKQGIRVNAVCPGPFWTPLTTVSMEPEKTANYGHQTQLKRPGQPREAAPLFVLLASEDGSFIANEVFVIAGGMPMPG
jgi:NAD(P)-dependent dehydrogenase (short-subunit alcohol dehydrogenase family)